MDTIVPGRAIGKRDYLRSALPSMACPKGSLQPIVAETRFAQISGGKPKYLKLMLDILLYIRER